MCVCVCVCVCEFSLRHYDLPNYRKDILKTDIFIQLMIQYGWSSSLILLTASQKIAFSKNPILKNDSAVSGGILGNLTCFT
jgi:hypothetical protein